MISERLGQLGMTHWGVPTANSTALMAALLEGAATPREERQLSSELQALDERAQESGRANLASPLWGRLHAAFDLAQTEQWGATLDEVDWLAGVRAGTLRRRIAAPGGGCGRFTLGKGKRRLCRSQAR